MEAAIGIIGALAYLGIVYLVMDLWGGTHLRKPRSRSAGTSPVPRRNLGDGRGVARHQPVPRGIVFCLQPAGHLERIKRGEEAGRLPATPLPYAGERANSAPSPGPASHIEPPLIP